VISEMPFTQLDAFAHLLLGPPTKAEVLAQLNAWSRSGCLRLLDAALARFLDELAPQSTTPELLLATALTAHFEGRGHTCLNLNLLCPPQRASFSSWPDAVWGQLQSLLERLPQRVEDWQRTLSTSPVVQAEETPDPPILTHPPLVLNAHRLYLRRYWQMEREVVQHIANRLQVPWPVDVATARVQLDLLFPTHINTAFDWQKLSCAIALRGAFTLITGGPGTGKTHTVTRLLALLWATHVGQTPLSVGLAAPTGKAAARLKQSIDHALLALPLGQLIQTDVPCAGVKSTLFPNPLESPPNHPFLTWAQTIGPARTLHAWLGARPHTRELQHHAANPLALDVFIVDEASMVDLEMMHNLLAALPSTTRLVLLGDPDQLASVEAGAVLADLCREARVGAYTHATADYALATTGQKIDSLFLNKGSALAQQTVMLRQSRRFTGPLGQLAQAVNQGDASAARALFQTPPHEDLTLLSGEHMTPLAVANLATQRGGYRHYLTLIKQKKSTIDPSEHATWVQSVLTAFDQFRVLCAVREGPWGVTGLNAVIEAQLAQQDGLIRPAGPWFEGRPVTVTRNDPHLGVFNGDIGIALKPPNPGAPLRVYFAQGDTLHSVSTQRLADVQTAFAMTVHKSQGSEFNHTVLVLPQAAPELLTRELIYTGITRAKKNLTLVSTNLKTFDDALLRPTVRFSGLSF
jgi:exodeoxyribonuclease V alpha subunit